MWHNVWVKCGRPKLGTVAVIMLLYPLYINVREHNLHNTITLFVMSNAIAMILLESVLLRRYSVIAVATHDIKSGERGITVTAMPFVYGIQSSKTGCIIQLQLEIS